MEIKKKVRLMYHVIVSLDIYKDHKYNLKDCKPTSITHPKFRVTETEVENTEYYKIHRKYVGILTPKETLEFIDDCDFNETMDTAGALTDVGLLAAVSFSSDSTLFNINAYISPILNYEDEEIILKEMENNPESERIRDRIMNKIEQSFQLLLDWDFNKPALAKSFMVDTKQLTLPNLFI